MKRVSRKVKFFLFLCQDLSRGGAVNGCCEVKTRSGRVEREFGEEEALLYWYVSWKRKVAECLRLGVISL